MNEHVWNKRINSIGFRQRQPGILGEFGYHSGVQLEFKSNRVVWSLRAIITSVWGTGNLPVVSYPSDDYLLQVNSMN